MHPGRHHVWTEDCRTLALHVSTWVPCRVGSRESAPAFSLFLPAPSWIPCVRTPVPFPVLAPSRHPLNRNWSSRDVEGKEGPARDPTTRADPQPGGISSAESWTPQTLMSLGQPRIPCHPPLWRASQYCQSRTPCCACEHSRGSERFLRFLRVGWIVAASGPSCWRCPLPCPRRAVHSKSATSTRCVRRAHLTCPL